MMTMKKWGLSRFNLNAWWCCSPGGSEALFPYWAFLGDT